MCKAHYLLPTGLLNKIGLLADVTLPGILTLEYSFLIGEENSIEALKPGTVPIPVVGLLLS